MAITDAAGMLAGMRQPSFFQKSFVSVSSGIYQTSWVLSSGWPRVGTVNAGLNGGTYTTTNQQSGALYRDNPLAGQEARISGARIACNGAASGMAFATVCVMDRIWDNTIDLTSTALQSITSPTWPARDANGASDGVGIFLGLELGATITGSAPTITVTYTNSDGVAGRSGGFCGTSPSGTGPSAAFFPIALQGADQGVRSVQSVQFGPAWTSGSPGGLVACRLITAIPIIGPAVPMTGHQLGFPKVFDGSTLFLLTAGQTNHGGPAGYIQESHG